MPELGYLPFEISLALPRSGRGHGCPRFALRDVSFVFTLHGQRPRVREYTPLTFTISGCGREAQLVRNLSVAALGVSTQRLELRTV